MDHAEVRARIERERSDQLDHSNKLIAIAAAVLLLIVGAVGAFVFNGDPFLSGSLTAALVPLTFLGILLGKALTRIEARVIVSAYRARGTGKRRDRLPLLVSMIQRGGVSLKVMADDILLEVVLAAYFFWLLGASTGIRWFAAALCGVMFLYTAVTTYVMLRLSARTQADVIRLASTRPSLKRPDPRQVAALVTIIVALACYVVGSVVIVDVARETPGLGASGATLYAALAWAAGWTLLPTLSTILLRRAADPTMDILHEIEKEFDARADTVQAERDMEAIKLSRGQLIALPRTLAELRSAYDATRAIPNSAPPDLHDGKPQGQ